MKRFYTFLMLALIVFAPLAKAQAVIEDFSTAAADTLFLVNDEGSEDSAILTDVDGTMHVKAVVGSFHSWGSYIHLERNIPDSTYVNWLPYDTLSLKLKIDEAPTIPEQMVMRMHIQDQLSWDGEIEEYIFEDGVIFDAVTDGFVELKIPLIDRDLDGQGNPDNTGFTFVPASWYAAPYNNHQIDWDKLVYWTITFVTTGTEADSMVVSFDELKSTGKRSVPAIFFNGKSVAGSMSAFTWGQSLVDIEENTGATEKTNSVKWTQGDEWGNGWSGIGWNIDPVFDLSLGWDKDSLKFKAKAPAGTGLLRMQFEDGTNKAYFNFTPEGDNQWHQYAFKLSEATQDAENSADFNTEYASVLGIMAVESAVAGTVIYFDDIWTGNPVFDIVAPDAPTLVIATAGAYSNLITWVDVPGESEEKYNLYASLEPITDINAEGVLKVAHNIDGGLQEANHTILSPTVDQSLTYYYALVCVDASGNESPVSESASVTNDAKGVTVIHPTAPVGFAADGDLSDWATIAPFRMYPSDGSGAIVTNSTIDGDADCSASAWLAVDDDYLYVAFDVEDDIIDTTAASTWFKDSPDLFIGLYNWTKGGHTSYKRGAEPDYHLRFNQDYLIFDAPGFTIDSVSSNNYEWKTKFPTGYTVEAKIPWTVFAEAGAAGGDVVFKPAERMRIPVDFSISDADGGEERDGELTYSKFNEGESYAGVDRWSHTFIGDGFIVSVDDEEITPVEFALSQNYPNPFNPATVIKYTAKENSFVTLKVFNMLGQEVATLVNEVKAAGTHQVNFDAAKLSSGVYIYQIKMNNFISTRKMMLLK